MFGTMPSCFLTASSKGCEAAGAASMVAGVGMRDMVLSFRGSAWDGRYVQELAHSKNIE